MATTKIYIKGVRIAEGDQTFKVNLSNAVGAAILDPEAVGTILNDD